MSLSTRLESYLNSMNSSAKQSRLGTLIKNLIAGTGVDLAAGNILKGSTAGVSEALDIKAGGKIVQGNDTSVEALDASGAGNILQGNATKLEVLDVSAGGNIVQGNDTKLEVLDASGVNKIVIGNATKLESKALDLSSFSEIDSAIELAEALRATMNAHAADATEHSTALDNVNFPLTSPVATDLASLVVLITEMQVDYTAHNADAILAAAWAFHAAQGTDRPLTSAVAPVTASDCVARLNDVKTAFNLHQADAVSHATGNVYPEDVADAVNEVVALGKKQLWKGRFKIQTGKNDTSGSYNIGAVIPDNAIITRAFVDVLTTFAGDGDDSSTIAITSGEGANDIVSAVAIKTATDWDAGLQEGIPVDTAATSIKMTSANQPQVVIAIAATDTLLASGEMIVFIEYVQSA